VIVLSKKTNPASPGSGGGRWTGGIERKESRGWIWNRQTFEGPRTTSPDQSEFEQAPTSSPDQSDFAKRNGRVRRLAPSSSTPSRWASRATTRSTPARSAPSRSPATATSSCTRATRPPFCSQECRYEQMHMDAAYKRQASRKQSQRSGSASSVTCPWPDANNHIRMASF
jgi:hypothetical protein